MPDLTIELDSTSNLAGNKDVAERVVAFMRDRVQQCKTDMEPLWRRWRLTFYMLSGNTIDQAGPMEVHVPALYQIIETMVPRLEEALLEKDPWFRVRPRRQEDEAKADTIAAFMDWQLDQAGFRSTVQEALRDFLVTQVACYKVRWDHRERMVREKAERYDDKKKKTVAYWQWKKKPVYSGPVYELVDPFDFLIDHRATDPQNAEYVGDISYYTIDELEHFEKQGFIQNVSKLKEEGDGSTSFGWDNTEYKRFRSPTERGTIYAENAQKRGLPRKIEVTTLCTKYSLNDDGVYEECVLIVGNGRVCLRASKNETQSQVRPYATARAARNGHNFFGTGPLDNAVRLNQHLDRLHAITLRTAEGVGCPMIFAEEDSDIPDSLYHTRPFRVIKGAGRVTIQSVPGEALNAMPGIMALINTNIETTAGAFRIQMGQETGGTATGDTLALQEGNRRMRGLIRNFSDLLVQLLKITDCYNVEYVDEEIPFQVLGKRAKSLQNRYLSVGPNTFLEAADFEIVGLASLHTYGLRATGMQNILSGAAELIVQNPSRVDQVAWLHMMTSDLIGPDEADRLIRIQPPRDQRMSQHAENVHLRKGTKIQVSESDPHEMHLEDMKQDLAKVTSDPEVDPHVLEAFVEHSLQHLEALDRQREQEAVADRERRMNGQLLDNDGGDGGSAPPGGFEPEMMPRGQNPGPPSQQKYGSAAKDNTPVAQTDNQPRR